MTERLSEGEVLAAWLEIVGETLAPHCQPHMLRNGTLMIRILRPTIGCEFEPPRGAIAAELRARFGEAVAGKVGFGLTELGLIPQWGEIHADFSHSQRIKDSAVLLLKSP